MDGSNVNLLVAFAAGFVTFFASCLLPLVPTYLAFLSGVALNTKEASKEKLQIMKVALFFVIGFISTFVLLSLSLKFFGGLLFSVRNIVEIVGGFIFIILGLFMLGVFKHRIFSQERRLDLRKIFSKRGLLGGALGKGGVIGAVFGGGGGFDINKFFSKYKSFHAFVTGVIFGFGWTPCIGPVLAVILFWSARADTALGGVLLLVAYGVGLGVPFLIVAAGFEKVIPQLKRFSKVSVYVSYLSGAVIILTGLLMISGEFQRISMFLIDLFGLRALTG